MPASNSKPSNEEESSRTRALKLTCHEVGHTWTPSCVKCFVELLVNGYIYSLKLYGPLYVIGAVITRFRTGKVKYLDVITGAGRSSLFLAANCAFMVTSFCFLRWLKGEISPSSGTYLPGMLCSFIAILHERKERRSLLALYMLNVCVDSIHKNLKDDGYPVSIKHGEVVMFCVASAFLVFLSNKKMLSGGIVSEFVRVLYQPSKIVSTDPSRFTSASLITSCIKDLSRAAAAGYAMKVIPNILFSIKSILKNPGKLLGTVSKRENFDLAVFFGSSVGLFQGLTYVLSSVFSLKKSTSSVIAASISGLSMFSYKSPTIALYALLKSLEGMYFYIAKKGYLPTYRHADSIIFAVVCGYILGLLLSEPQRVNQKYFRFVTCLTNFRMYDINRKALDKLGYNGSEFIEQLKVDIMSGKKTR